MGHVEAGTLVAISSDCSSCVMQNSGDVTAVLDGEVSASTCARVTFVLGKEHSGDVDFGIVSPDGSHGLFYFGLTGEVAALKSDASNKPFQWLPPMARHACGPALRGKDEISLELSLAMQPQARPPTTSVEEWEHVVGMSLKAPQRNAPAPPHTIPHHYSTLAFFINGVAVSAPHPWEGGGEIKGKFSVRFHEEGDCVDVKGCSWKTMPTFFPVSLETAPQELKEIQHMHANVHTSKSNSMGAARGNGAVKSVYSLQGVCECVSVYACACVCMCSLQGGTFYYYSFYMYEFVNSLYMYSLYYALNIIEPLYLYSYSLHSLY